MLNRLDAEDVDAFPRSLKAVKEASERSGLTRDWSTVPEECCGDVRILRDAS